MDFFDQIYCINLKERTDRYRRVKRVFKKLNINVNFYRPNRDKVSGLKGCFESHLNILKDAHNKGYNNILVFEDDIGLSENYSKRALRECVRFMKSNKKWDIFYLGVVPDLRISDTEHVSGSIYKLIGLCTHAVCYSKKFIKKMSKIESWNGESLDFFYRKFKQQYAYYPSLFYQIDEISDINNSNLKGISPAFLEFYVKILEKYAFHIGIKLSNLIIILVVVIALFFLYRFYKKSTNKMPSNLISN
jgi:GR25 family glycosyltransferase involved in LPS biosynthesis